MTLISRLAACMVALVGALALLQVPAHASPSWPPPPPSWTRTTTPPQPYILPPAHTAPRHKTITVPASVLDRDTGWHGWQCDFGGTTGVDQVSLIIYIDVIWYAPSNERQIIERAWNLEMNGSTVDTGNLGFWVTAVGGNWLNYYNVASPDQSAYYARYYTPSLNPGQGHYFLARNRDTNDGDTCDLQVLN